MARKAVTAHLERERRATADKRLGATPEDRLRWLVNDFLATNLDDLLLEERTALGYVLRQLTPPVGWGVKREPRPLSDEDLRAVQERLRHGLNMLTRRTGSLEVAVYDPSGGWALPLPRRDRLVRTSAEGAKPATFMLLAEAESEGDAIVRAVADLVLRAGRQLRACALPECARPFVARRKGQFCREEHAMRSRNKRRKPRPRKRTPRTAV
jgi:hypothetical protein